MDLSRLTGRNVKVAIIDSGIDPTHEKVGPVESGIQFSATPDGQITELADHADCFGHGTACAGIIRKKAPQALLYSVRVFDQSLSTSGEALISAVHWCIDNQMDVANLSLGSTDISIADRLRATCKLAVESGLILVAAEHNSGRESYPAFFPEVIGVAGSSVEGRYGYYYNKGEVIECVARGNEQRLCWLDSSQVMAGGTSFAAPHLSAIVTLIREAFPGAELSRIRKILRAHAIAGEPERRSGRRHGAVMHGVVAATGSWSRQDFSWIRKAALYPYNKEMHSFVRYRDQLSFELVGVADPPGKGLVGKDAGEAIGIQPTGLCISPRLADAIEDADTLILGYVDELSRIAGRDVLHESVKLALDNGIDVFSFLPVTMGDYGDLHEQAQGKNVRIVFPWITQEDVQNALASRPPAVDVPVLGVFGTSSQQGKFTVQLALRQHLRRRGYRVGQIGTEHQAGLFGMDFAFPMGYASPLEMPMQQYAPFLNTVIRQIAVDRQPDIITVGSQSGTTPFAIDEPSTHSLSSISFLLGTRPDACILVVNSIDPDEYIQDTIDVIRAVGKAPVILLAMSDKEKHVRSAYERSWVTQRQMSRAEIDARVNELQNRFDMPAIEIVSIDGQQKMTDVVIDYFAADGKTAA